MSNQIEFINKDFIKVFLDKENIKFFICNYEDWINLASNYNWKLHKNGQGIDYVSCHYKNKTIYFHRLINKTKKEQVCDHRNGNGLDNRKINLRNCYKKQNNKNSKPRKGSKSPYPGVSWNKKYKKWRVRIVYNKKEIGLGMFSSLEEAIKIKKEKEKELFNHYSLEYSRQNNFYKTLEDIIKEIKDKDLSEINKEEWLNYLRKQTGIFTVIFKNTNKEKDLIVQKDEKTNCWNVISHLNGNPYPMYRKERLYIFIYKWFKGKIPKNLLIRHTCDNPRCCNPDHLILGTYQDNVNDMYERDRRKLKLTKEEIVEIALDDSGNYSFLAKKYNLPVYTVSRIKNKQLKYFNSYEVKNSFKNKRKLTEKEIIEIYCSDATGKILSEKYNISESTVYDIKNKRIHKNIIEKYLKGEII